MFNIMSFILGFLLGGMVLVLSAPTNEGCEESVKGCSLEWRLVDGTK